MSSPGGGVYIDLVGYKVARDDRQKEYIVRTVAPKKTHSAGGRQRAPCARGAESARVPLRAVERWYAQHA
jgi:hypothetical protein